MSSKAKFQDAWLLNPDFQPWLTRADGDPTKAYCTFCKRGIGAEITTLRRHKKTKLHATSEDMAHTVSPEADPAPPATHTTNAVALATVLLCCFLAENNLPFSLADQLVSVQKRMFPDSIIAQTMSVRRTKCTEVVRALGKAANEELVKKLRVCKFSIIIDETTDISSTKSCAIVVRYLDTDTNTIKTEMLDLIDVHSNNNNGSSGENLYLLITQCITNHNIPFENLIGFAADGASNIMGEHNSVCSRLRALHPGITIFRCICHSIHLCASEAAKTLPRHCEDLLRNIYSYFSHSAKRKNEFKEFQEFCQTKPHKILHVSQTRWLSLHQAVSRVLEQWRPLTLYFTSKAVEERLVAVQTISSSLNDPSILCYFHFLNYVLPKFNRLNLLFQKQTPTIHLLHESLTNLYRTLILMFCSDHVVHKTQLEDIDPTDEAHYLPLHQIFLGHSLHTYFQSEGIRDRVSMIMDVRTRCRQFLVTMCCEIKRRFPLGDKLWKLSSYLTPTKALDSQSKLELTTLGNLVKEVPRIYQGDIDQLDDEWRLLPWHPFPDNIKRYDASQFYRAVMEAEDLQGNKMFKLLGNFALHILSLPTSNADAERLFSRINLMKTKVRNSLQNTSIISLISLAECVKAQGGCHQFNPSQAMIDCATR